MNKNQDNHVTGEQIQEGSFGGKRESSPVLTAKVMSHH